MRITEEIGIFRPFYSLSEKNHDAFIESYAMIPTFRTKPRLKSEQPSSKTVMTVYGKAVAAEHLAAVLDYLKRIGAVRQYQLGGFLHQFHGFGRANGQSQEAAGRILQRLKKQGLVRYTICGWRPKE